MISLLCPTRRRPAQFARMVKSARTTASSQIEIVAYLDDDDPESEAAAKDLGVLYKVGPRIILTDTWNKCAQIATGDIFQQCNDDVVFRTPGWDKIVEKEFQKYPDKLVLVFGDDLHGACQNTYGPHAFVHRRWVDLIGYFIPPYFSSDFGDCWINELATRVNRRFFLPFIIEHMHIAWGTAEMDDTTRERLKRHDADNPQQIFNAVAPILDIQTEKLRKAIRGIPQMDTKFTIMILTQPSRAGYLSRLLDRLKPQIDEHPDVEIDIRMFQAGMSLGENRECMRRAARGQYIAFIDDDDLVPKDYLDTVCPLLDGVDYIGFQLQFSIDGVNQNPTYHSLRYPGWNADNRGAYRDISHVNPIRRDLALLVPMSGEFGEDSRWSDSLRKKSVVKTEHYIDKIMYFYLWRSDKSDGGPRTRTPTPYAVPIQTETCPSCGSKACGMAGGMRRCNQCQHAWI